MQRLQNIIVSATPVLEKCLPPTSIRVPYFYMIAVEFYSFTKTVVHTPTHTHTHTHTHPVGLPWMRDRTDAEATT
jgi:hypothetical protein